MNIDTKVTTALSALGLPIARDEYVKDDKRAIPVNEYITFNYVIEDPICRRCRPSRRNHISR